MGIMTPFGGREMSTRHGILGCNSGTAQQIDFINYSKRFSLKEKRVVRSFVKPLAVNRWKIQWPVKIDGFRVKIGIIHDILKSGFSTNPFSSLFEQTPEG